MQALSKLLFQALFKAGQEGGATTKNNVVVQLALDVCFAAVHGVDDAVHNALVLLNAAQTKQLQLLFSKQTAVEQTLGDSKPDDEKMSGNENCNTNLISPWAGDGDHAAVRQLI